MCVMAMLLVLAPPSRSLRQFQMGPYLPLLLLVPAAMPVRLCQQGRNLFSGLLKMESAGDVFVWCDREAIVGQIMWTGVFF